MLYYIHTLHYIHCLRKTNDGAIAKPSRLYFLPLAKHIHCFVSEPIRKSCMDVLEANAFSALDGFFNIDPDGQDGAPGFQVMCHLAASHDHPGITNKTHLVNFVYKPCQLTQHVTLQTAMILSNLRWDFCPFLWITSPVCILKNSTSPLCRTVCRGIPKEVLSGRASPPGAPFDTKLHNNNNIVMFKWKQQFPEIAGKQWRSLRSYKWRENDIFVFQNLSL